MIKRHRPPEYLDRLTNRWIFRLKCKVIIGFGMQKIRLLFGLILLSFFFKGCTATPHVQRESTLEGLYKKYPERLHTLFAALDLQQDGLEKVKEGLHQGDTVAAAKALLDYYRQLERSWIVTTLDSIPMEAALLQANSLLNDTLIREGKAYWIPRTENGRIQWNYTGPDGDDEFGYALNGHKYLPALYMAWEKDRG